MTLEADRSRSAAAQNGQPHGGADVSDFRALFEAMPGGCVALAPDVMALDGRGRAYARARALAWSPADGDFVGQCPTGALGVVPLAVPAATVAHPAAAADQAPHPGDAEPLRDAG